MKVKDGGAINACYGKLTRFTIPGRKKKGVVITFGFDWMRVNAIFNSSIFHQSQLVNAHYSHQ